MREAYRSILHHPRPVSTYRSMPVENRAKLFIPFAALRGFDLALLTKEHDRLLVPRVSLSPERIGELLHILTTLHPGATVRITHFIPTRRGSVTELGRYVTSTGHLDHVDKEKQELVLWETHIALDNIRDVQACVTDQETSA